jgi:hypothetical protein
MPRTPGARRAQPKTEDALRIARAKDAERKRKAYWADPEAARAKNREKRRRNPRNPELERERNRERAKTPRGREINRACVRGYQKAHPQIVAAHQATKAAVRRGEIKVPSVCEVIGCDRNRRLHGHHRRYDKPIDIVFVCHEHHEHVHHHGALKLKAGSARRWARAPRHEQGNAVNSSR